LAFNWNKRNPLGKRNPPQDCLWKKLEDEAQPRSAGGQRTRPEDGPSNEEQESETEESNSESRSDTGSESSDGKEKQKKGKKEKARKEKAQEKKRQKDLKAAQRLATSIAPILSGLKSSKERLTANVKALLPEYQIMDLENHFNVVSELDQQTNLVIKGQSTLKKEKLGSQASNLKLAQARTASQAFAVSLAGAERVIDKRARDDVPAPPKNKKKKKKGRKD